MSLQTKVSKAVYTRCAITAVDVSSRPGAHVVSTCWQKTGSSMASRMLVDTLHVSFGLEGEMTCTIVG